MDSASDLPSSRADAALSTAAGIAAGSVFLALADAYAIARLSPAAPFAVRFAHHAVDAAETLGVGLAFGMVICSFVYLVRLPRRWFFALAAVLAVGVTAAITQIAIGENLTRATALAWDGKHETALFVTASIGVAILIPGACFAAKCIAKTRYLFLLPVLIAVGVVVVIVQLHPDDYQGIYGVVVAGAAMLAGGGLADRAARAARAFWTRRSGRLALALLGLVAAAGLLVPPPDPLRTTVFQIPFPIAPWVLATALWRAPSLHHPAAPLDIFPGTDPTRDVPPSPTRVLSAPSVVVLVTVDAVRADAIDDPANDALFHTFAKLKRDGVRFTQAFAPATQTALSLSTLFSGRTFSELKWVDHGAGRLRFLYPAEDPSPRFPELLSAHGVATAEIASLSFLTNDYGVLRGFHDQKVVVVSSAHARAEEVIDPLLLRLDRSPREPLFLYAHLMEPHAPYDRGVTAPGATDHARYLAEIAVADAQIGRVLARLETKFGARWALIVTSDHGEAFGEHGMHGHAKTLYDELLHVPLLVRSPHLSPHVVTDPVGLVDVGPTILDLFDVATPPEFLGQSLVPALVGKESASQASASPRLFPLTAEGRLRQAMRLPNGIKVIEDLRRKSVEVYDLSVDPGETRNIVDSDPARSDEALATLRAYFVKHTRAGTDGYVVPYKP